MFVNLKSEKKNKKIRYSLWKIPYAIILPFFYIIKFRTNLGSNFPPSELGEIVLD